MNVTAHAAASQVAEEWQSEGIAHGVDVQVWDKLCQRLPAQEDGAYTLSQQREVRKQAGLDQLPVPQEDKLNRPREDDVETAPCPVQDLLAGHTQVSRVDHEVDVHIPAQKRTTFSSLWHKQYYNAVKK